jgi:hypothetical protein
VPLNALGWIFMITSVSFVTGLAGWCFYKVLTEPHDADGNDPVDRNLRSSPASTVSPDRSRPPDSCP